MEDRKKVEKKFYGICPLKNIHYYRYMKELEWENATSKDIVKDIRKDAKEMLKHWKRKIGYIQHPLSPSYFK